LIHVDHIYNIDTTKKSQYPFTHIPLPPKKGATLAKSLQRCELWREAR